ncbi:MAG TPA: DUF1549 domain-containing protein [Bryobacteraceae bacterium]|nr:DUF1549 domain-containing protein [Bryobacteraceae bacterium]
MKYLVLLTPVVLWAGDSLAVLPAKVALSTPESSQQLIAEFTSSSFQQDLTAKTKWSSSNPAVASVDESGMVKPASDGETDITGLANGQSATAHVVVKGVKAPFTWSFRNHVIPVMTKVGCNQGACHGALAGKNGFKLTLRGYDPDVDYDTLTRQSVGRRVSLAEPPASLILLKPTFTIPHGGGKRFGKDSLEYKIISGWIAEGAPAPGENDPEVTNLEVFPAAATLQTGAQQQLIVRAKYSDGHVEDVTHWVKYSSNNEGTASVDDNGRVKMNGPGEAAVTLWYSSHVSYSRLTVPYPNQVASDAYDRFARHNYIDNLVVDKLRKLNIAPSRPADDATFLRRAYLDAAGVLPTSEVVENFLADKSADKREKLIDRITESDEFVDYWAYKWSDLLLVSSRRLRSNAMWAFYDWIRQSVKEDKPWDKFAREIFTTSGSSREHGALNYFVLHKDPIDLAETSTEAFLGQRVTCARCHNHPLEKWTQTQYYELVNLFARVGIKNGNQPGDDVVFAKTSGDVMHPRLLKPLPPTPLDGKSIPIDSPVDRRVVFADWMTSPNNPYFARSLVNRVWGNFMGRGLVNPVDDVRATNPASNEELLTALTEDFVRHRYDVKYLIRTIMQSSVYQLSSEANATNQNDNIFYSRYIIKRLPAEVILDAYSQVTGVPTAFGGYPAGTRALQLPDTQVKSEFLTVFGRPARQVCDSSERSSDATIGQALHVINGDTLNKKLSAPDGYITLFLKLGLSDSRIVDQVFLTSFSRYPRESEKAALLANLQQARLAKGTPEAMLLSRRQGLEDMLWALLTDKEFLFNH